MQKDSVVGTVVVATLLCVVCSVLVSGAAVSLKDRQVANKILDVKKNLLLASGLLKDKSASKEVIEREFSKISAEVVDLSTGEIQESMDAETFDQRKASKDPEKSKSIESENDLAGIKVRSKLAKVYKLMNGDSVEMYIFPIHGKGLWSTMYGFLALAPDFQTVKGIGFYEHAETPGLGGEIQNESWQAQWVGKKIFDEGDYDDVKFRVTKGSVDPSNSESDHMVDGLSGATITSNGVTGTVRYWLGQNGFGKYIENQTSASTSNEETDEEEQVKNIILEDAKGEA